MGRDYAQLTWDSSGALAFRFSYNPMMVEALKSAIPPTERRWDPSSKAWDVTPRHAALCSQLCAQHLGLDVPPPSGGAPAPQVETAALDVRYIGACKDRGTGDRSAFGWSDGGWSVVFPEPVLMAWFGLDIEPDQRAAPSKAQTLYGVLGIRQAADATDVRKAYRRLALQWHPDRCHEPDAQAVFIRIQQAYETINDPARRKRYDAGLLMEASQPKEWRPDRGWMNAITIGYRAPLRCGLILAEGRRVLGRFIVERIHAWEDIHDVFGRTLVTSWPMGADAFEEEWV